MVITFGRNTRYTNCTDYLSAVLLASAGNVSVDDWDFFLEECTDTLPAGEANHITVADFGDNINTEFRATVNHNNRHCFAFKVGSQDYTIRYNSVLLTLSEQLNQTSSTLSIIQSRAAFSLPREHQIPRPARPREAIWGKDQLIL